jgi:hypothetical protein
MMKATAVFVIALAVLVVVPFASAGTLAGKEIISTHENVQCHFVPVGGIACVSAYRHLAVCLDTNRIAISNLQTAARVWRHAQPATRLPVQGGMPPYYSHLETHYGFTCGWGPQDGGYAACWRADRYGDVAVVSHKRVSVGDGRGHVIYNHFQQ